MRAVNRTRFLSMVSVVGLSYLLPVSTLYASPSYFHLTDASAQLNLLPTASGTDSIGLAIADVDNDGDLDFLIAEGSGGFEGFQNRLFLNDGDGVFTDVSTSHMPLDNANSAGVDFGDVDGDGDVDAIIANVGPNQLLLNDGHGHFSDASAQLPGPYPNILDDISAQAIFFDIDGDGDLDIFVCNEIPFPGTGITGAQNRIWINDGSGHFTDETATRLPQQLDHSANVRFADLDKDGWVDAVVANNGQNSVLINQGGGVFVDEGKARLGELADSSRSVAIGDFDGDGNLDLIFANSRGQQDELYFNTGNGYFVDVTQSNLPDSTQSNTSVQLADFDCDGDLDAFITSVNTGPAHDLVGAPNHFLMNTGRGRFVDISKLVLPDISLVSFDAVVGYFNKDHSLDILIANNSAGTQESLLLSAQDKQPKFGFDEAWKNVFKNQCE